MNVVILGVLSTKFAAAAGGFLFGFLLLLAVMLLLHRRSRAQMRPLLIAPSLGPSAQIWLPARTNTRWLVDMASRAPPPVAPRRQSSTRGRSLRE